MATPRPMNPTAARAADEQLWADNPQLAGRKLTMDPSDQAYRQQWMDAYKQSVREQGAASPTSMESGKVGGPARSCAARTTADLLVTVRTRDDGTPIQGANVRVTGPESRKGATDGSGQITFRGIAAGAYTVRAEKAGYGMDTRPCQVVYGAPNQADLVLADTVLRVTVKDRENGAPVADATVKIAGPEKRDAVTDAAGQAEFRHLRPGEYTVEASKDDYDSDTSKTAVGSGQTVQVELELAKGLLRIRLFDVARMAMALAPYRVTLDGKKREGYSDSQGWVKLGMGSEAAPERCQLEWGEGDTSGAYRYKREIFLRVDGSGSEQAMRRRFHNLGYSADRPLDQNVRRFRSKYDLDEEGDAVDTLNLVRDEHDRCFKSCRELFAGLAAGRPASSPDNSEAVA